MPYILHFMSEPNVSEKQSDRASGGSRCYTQPHKLHQEPEVSKASIWTLLPADAPHQHVLNPFHPCQPMQCESHSHSKKYNLSSVSKSATCCTLPGNILSLLLTITAPSMLAPINHREQEKTNTKLLTGKSGVRPRSALHHWQTSLICLQQKTFMWSWLPTSWLKPYTFWKHPQKGAQRNCFAQLLNTVNRDTS